MTSTNTNDRARLAEDGGGAAITDLLFIQPSPALMEAAREVLRRQHAAMDPAARRSRIDTIIGRCEQVAETSGGVWIIGAASAEERRRIAAVWVGLAGPDTAADAGPPEFPH